MGRPDDLDAATDARGRLVGVERLFDVDTSVIPRVSSANTHLAVIALAERLSGDRWPPAQGFSGAPSDPRDITVVRMRSAAGCELPD